VVFALTLQNVYRTGFPRDMPTGHSTHWWRLELLHVCSLGSHRLSRDRGRRVPGEGDPGLSYHSRSNTTVEFPAEGRSVQKNREHVASATTRWTEEGEAKPPVTCFAVLLEVFLDGWPNLDEHDAVLSWRPHLLLATNLNLKRSMSINSPSDRT
jgi:hypothetical protein